MKLTIIRTLVVLLLVLLPALGFFIGQKNAPISPANVPTVVSESQTQTTNGWIKPVSTDQGFPIVKEDKLYVYSVTTKKLDATIYQTIWGGGEFGRGEGRPQVSPDGKLVAFINRGDDDTLYLLPVGTQKAQKITSFPVEYINSWSSDSSKILYFVQKDSLTIRKSPDAMGNPPTWSNDESFLISSAPGFHSFNVRTGVDTYLYPLDTVDKFIDSSRVITEIVKDGDQNKNAYHLVIFDVDTFRGDFSTVDYPITSFGQQRYFSADGKHWAFTDSLSTNQTTIVYSDFPNKIGTNVDIGGWAFIQKPMLNSTSRYLAYTKRGEQIKEGTYAGQYSNTTVIWDTAQKKIVKQTNGWPEYWFGENMLVIGRSEYGNNPASFMIFDIYHADTGIIDSVQIP